MSVCLSTSHSHLLFCRSFWANKTIFKVFQRFQFEQKFLYSKNSSTSKSVPCIVVVNAHCSGPQKENRHLHSLSLLLAICVFFALLSELKTPTPGTYQKTLTLTTERVSRNYLLFTTPCHHRRRRRKKYTKDLLFLLPSSQSTPAPGKNKEKQELHKFDL